MKDCLKKSAFIAILGVPNVGKSSILNVLVGNKIAAVSSKPQTTRNRIMGILTQGDYQLVFIDTPGFHEPKNHLGNYMVKVVMSSISSVDGCLLVIDAGKDLSNKELSFFESLKKVKMPIILVINKIDKLKDKSVLFKKIQRVSEIMEFNAIVPVSAKTGDGMKDLLAELKDVAVDGGHFFGGDDITDQPTSAIISEIIREKILLLTDKEIPHGVAVCIEKISLRADRNLMDVYATIYCEKNNHKGILVGKNGCMLKKVGSAARRDIEQLFEKAVNLKLWIKVKEDWRNNLIALKNFGFDEKNLNF